jgi:hypothetical protein
MDIRKVYKVRKEAVDTTIPRWNRIEKFFPTKYIDLCPLDFYLHIGNATYSRRVKLTDDEKIFFKALQKAKKCN